MEYAVVTTVIVMLVIYRSSKLQQMLSQPKDLQFLKF